jgi:hypothetical protein
MSEQKFYSRYANEKPTTEGIFRDCGCHYTTSDDGIHWCPLHHYADEILEALIGAVHCMSNAQNDAADIGGRKCAEATYFDSYLRKERKAVRNAKGAKR